MQAILCAQNFASRRIVSYICSYLDNCYHTSLSYVKQINIVVYRIISTEENLHALLFLVQRETFASWLIPFIKLFWLVINFANHFPHQLSILESMKLATLPHTALGCAKITRLTQLKCITNYLK